MEIFISVMIIIVLAIWFANLYNKINNSHLDKDEVRDRLTRQLINLTSNLHIANVTISQQENEIDGLRQRIQGLNNRLDNPKELEAALDVFLNDGSNVKVKAIAHNKKINLIGMRSEKVEEK